MPAAAGARAPLPVPRLHVVTDDARLRASTFVADAAGVLEAGGAHVALHLRGRTTTAARLHELTTRLLPVARETGAKLLLNDRVDVALITGADGAQLREESLDVTRARALLGDEALIGLSRHAATLTPGEHTTADFIVFGHVFATGSHAGGEPAGREGLERAVAWARHAGPPAPHHRLPSAWTLPVIAIGGITPDRVAGVLAAGAFGVAVLSGAWGAGARDGDVRARVAAYVAELSAHAGADA